MTKTLLRKIKLLIKMMKIDKRNIILNLFHIQNLVNMIMIKEISKFKIKVAENKG